MAENEEFSLILRCWLDPQTNTRLFRMVNVATGKEIHTNDTSFLLRISIDAQTSTIRCYIRHIASGNEAYVQGGPKLRAFIQSHLLQEGKKE